MPPRLTDIALSLPATVPFVGPETLERRRGRPFRARVGANESGFGPSPRVVQAICQAAGESWKYCDPENHDLRQALAERLGARPQNIAIGEGIDGLLGLAVRLFAPPGSAVVTSLGAYPTFNYHVAGFGARLVTVPFSRDREDLDGLLSAAKSEKAAIVYLSNPDNPMGTWWPAEDVSRFVDQLPGDTLLILDEAYGETAPEGTLPALDLDRDNVIRMRTFSKAYGLAGLRCGYAIGAAETIINFDKVRNHFGVNRTAQVAALAALGDDTHLASVVTSVTQSRSEIGRIVMREGLEPLPSATNFVTVDCGQDGAFATRVLEQLVARDIFVRKPMAPVLDRCIRISTGSADEIEMFRQALPEALQAARKEDQG